MFKQKANERCNNGAFSAVSLLSMADSYDRLLLAAQLLHPEEHIDGPSALGLDAADSSHAHLLPTLPAVADA